MSSRQDRRRQLREKTEAAGPKHHPDPMRNVYIGFAIAIVAVFIAFALFNLKQQHDYAVANATPSPGPNASAKPIQLVDAKPLGSLVFGTPQGDVYGGGGGSPVDGIRCDTMEGATLHIHSHLAIFVNGKQLQIPSLIGIVPTGTNSGCFYWVHTHDSSGIIHVESPELRDYTLGNFFHIWGVSLSPHGIATYKGPVTAFVNGAKYDGDLASIPLSAHNQITLEVGSPVVTPPNYKFPSYE